MGKCDRGIKETLGLEEQLELFDGSPVVVYTCKPDGDFGATFISRGISAQLGWQPGDFLKDPGFWASHIHPDDRERVFAGLEKLFEEGHYSHEYRFRHKDGSYCWMSDILRLDRDETGNPLRIVGYWTDISAQKQVEREVRESEARYSTLVETMNDGLGVIDEHGEITYVNDRVCEMFGYSRDEMLGQKVVDLLLPDEVQRIKFVEQIRARAGSSNEPYEIEYTCKDGTTIPTLMSPQPIFDSAGDSHGSFAIMTDITERKKSEAAIRESNRVLELLFQYLPTSLVILDRDFNFVRVNESYARECGRDASEFPGLNHFDLYPSDDSERIFRTVREKKEPFQTLARPFTFPDHPEWGETYWDWALMPILDERGEVELLLWSIKNVTEEKRLEDQFRQAQKMDAVGQLTGGIAHDFNNLLTIILGNLELLCGRLQDEDLLNFGKKSIEAGLRGAELTQQLLAFSRKQALVPKVIDLNEHVGGIIELMSRALGEEIQIKTLKGENLWQCRADLGQLENAILNLALNARDAMPDGGTLAIETRNIHFEGDQVVAADGLVAGNYVTISVSDTGTGMPPEMIDQVFEPFFTTKDVGKGSGLGLSMVYGFIKQSGGDVKIESEEGRGTTVTLYLPRSVETSASAKQAGDDEVFCGRGEKIILIEDQADVREIIVDMLNELKYQVVEATQGNEALEILQSSPEFDLLLSDIVLPGGMNGVDVAEKARRSNPGIKVLLITGYADDTEMRKGAVGASFEVLRKPFSKSVLSRRVRSILDEAIA